MKTIKKISLFVLCTILISHLCLVQVEAKSTSPNLNKTKTTLYVGETTN